MLPAANRLDRGGSRPLMMQLRLLGPFELRRLDGARVALPGRQSMAIIACLGLAEGFSLARDRLADLIWAGRGEQADVSLRQELVRLRRALGEDALPLGGAVAQPVRINPEQVDIDVARFRSAAAASGGASEALTLYRGPLLEDFPLRPNEPLGEWFGGHRERLHNIARALMLRLLRSGEGSQALAERLIAIDPLCEEGYRFLIRRFAAEGDLAGAQQRYEACANAFAAAGLQTSLEIRTLMDDARAETASASAGRFQLAHPSAATQATHWLRAALGQPNPLQRPQARFVPEIADRPSIAVLPFDDLSETSAPGDPYLGDFVTEEITAALSRIRGLFVCSRHSASAYRGAPKDARAIACELGVRYLVEGAISRNEDVLRCNVRLIDGRTGLHIWADRVEAAAGEHRELRDRIVRETAARLSPRVLIAEVLRESEQREPPRDAYAALMRAKAELLREQSYAENLTRALAAARTAVTLDPESGEAHAMIAYLLTLLSWSRMSAQPLRDNWRARRHLREALKVGVGGSALAMCSETALIGAHDIDHALALAEAAVCDEPDDAHALALLGHIRRMAGEDPRASIALVERAQRLSPRDPRTFLWLLYGLGCHWKLGEMSEMEALARRSIALYAAIPWNWMGLAQALALQGRLDEAREAIEPVRAMMPGYTPSRFHWGARYVYGSRFRGEVEHDYRVLRDALNACLARPMAPPSR
jgi:TolB-like protein/DNA-binding SARP family transcriptional activator